MLRGGGDPVRGRARRHRRGRRARLRGHPGDAPRRRQRGRLRHRPRGSRTSPSRRSTGPRWPRSPARWSSTWASGAAAIAERLIAGGRPADEPRGRGRARHAARPAHGRRARWRRSPRAARRSGIRAPAITLVGPVAALREQLALVRARPLRGRDGRRHARAGAGERAGRAAARARRRGGRGAGDPDRPARRTELPDLGRYDLLCVTSPNGVRAALRRAASARAATPARWPACGSRRSAPGTARALREHGVERRRRARARRRRGAGRGAGRRRRSSAR